MTSRSRRWLALGGAAVVAAWLIVPLLPPDTRDAVPRAVTMIVGIAIAAMALRRSAGATHSSAEQFESELRRPAEATHPVPGLRSAEMAVRLSTANAQDFELRLKPMLRELAGWLLLRNRGVDIDAQPAAAARLLGEPLVRLINDAAHPEPFRAPGIRLADLEAGLDQLERI